MPISVEKLTIWLTEQDRPYYHPDSNIPKIILSIKKLKYFFLRRHGLRRIFVYF
jgi:hypothetical protein